MLLKMINLPGIIFISFNTLLELKIIGSWIWKIKILHLKTSRFHFILAHWHSSYIQKIFSTHTLHLFQKILFDQQLII